MTNWNELIAEAMSSAKDSGPIIATTLNEADLLRNFDDGYGVSEGEPFTAWTEDRVYFPAVYDGSEWVGSVPRNPSSEKTGHIGFE